MSNKYNGPRLQIPMCSNKFLYSQDNLRSCIDFNESYQKMKLILQMSGKRENDLKLF